MCLRMYSWFFLFIFVFCCCMILNCEPFFLQWVLPLSSLDWEYVLQISSVLYFCQLPSVSLAQDKLWYNFSTWRCTDKENSIIWILKLCLVQSLVQNCQDRFFTLQKIYQSCKWKTDFLLPCQTILHYIPFCKWLLCTIIIYRTLQGLGSWPHRNLVSQNLVCSLWRWKILTARGSIF